MVSSKSDRRFRVFRLYLGELEGQGPSTRAILRDHREPSHLPRRLDRARSGRDFHGSQGSHPAFKSGRRTTTRGNLHEDELVSDLAANCAGELAGFTRFVEDGILCFEYNLFIIQRTRSARKTADRQGPDRDRNDLAAPQPGGPLKEAMKVDGKMVAEARRRSARRCSLPPTTASTSASLSDRRFSITQIKRRSSSTAL